MFLTYDGLNVLMDLPRTGSHSKTNVTLPRQQSGSSINNSSPSPCVPIGMVGPMKRPGPTPVKSRSGERPGKQELEKIVAARVIERCWCSYRDRQMFNLLKHAVCAAEHSLTYEVLRKVIPAEAQLIKDPSVRARVRFRFAGSEFPPIVLFKIYTHTEGIGLSYLSGKKCIKPASEAASDACRLMGHRLFYDQMIADTCQLDQDLITDEVDVTTTKDYMQYLSNLDEMPAHMGGRDNLWRRLDLHALPRTTILYDILDYVENGRAATPRLQSEIQVLRTRPVTQQMQLEHIKLISKIRTPSICTPTPRQAPKSGRLSQPGETARRSRQAMYRANRMRKMYADGKQDQWMESGDGVLGVTPQRGEMEDEEEWQHEADKLYEWTQELSYEDIGVASPS